MAVKLRIAGVSKSYGGNVVLRPTSLELAQGEFLSLLGPSGSGKTTLLSLIAGLVEPDEGRIEIDGVDVTRLPVHRRGLGMVFQNYALFPHLSVAENVAFGLTTRRLPESQVRERTAAALAMVRLEKLADRLPAALSGGQQQRVALARALAYSPSVILMDEPLGALDRNLREEMKAEIARLHRELGMTVVYVTHDQEEALVLSSRVCLMAQAGVEQVGTPAELYFQPASRYAAEFIGESNLLPCTPGADSGLDVPALGASGIAHSARSTGWLLVRPESVEFGPASNAQFACRARVDSVQMLGASTRFEFTVLDAPGAGRLTGLMRTSRRPAAVPGETVELAIPLEQSHFIPASSEA